MNSLCTSSLSLQTTRVANAYHHSQHDFFLNYSPQIFLATICLTAMVRGLVVQHFLDVSSVKEETVVGHGIALTASLLEISSHAVQEERKTWVWVE